MSTVTFGGRSFSTDSQGFLKDPAGWDRAFAEGMAVQAGIEDGLTPRHWEVIRFIREEFGRTGECPLVFTTCRAAGMTLREMERLFPSGYMRGACKLAGITYRDRFVDFYGEPSRVRVEAPEAAESRCAEARVTAAAPGKVYRVDVLGFLIDPEEWDEDFAIHKAREIKLPGGLTARHLEVLGYLRDYFGQTGRVATVIECCAASGLDLEGLERLFPDGYQRGAVKLAGLCVRPGT